MISNDSDWLEFLLSMPVFSRQVLDIYTRIHG